MAPAEPTGSLPKKFPEGRAFHEVLPRWLGAIVLPQTIHGIFAYIWRKALRSFEGECMHQ